MSKGTSTTLLRNLHLLPFLAVAVLGALVLVGWWTDQVNWVQPRAYDVPFPANAAFCFFALGLTPLLSTLLPRRRISAAPAFLATALALIALLNAQLDGWPNIEDLLVRHDRLIDGASIGRVPTLMAGLLIAAGALLAWLGRERADPRRSLLLALVGSLACAYGFTALLAGRIGLTRLDFWTHHAHIGPQAAIALQLLGVALVLLAARDAAETAGAAGPRWLWLPVVTVSTTITVLFWVSLREREIAYLNNTTQLTLNTVASAFKAETEVQINNLRRMAERWTDSGGTPLASWEKDARAHAQDFPAYRSISWVDANFRTRWFWPREGNEDAASFDHRQDPLRLRALTAARETLAFSLAAPIVSPVQPPSLAVYATVLSGGTFDGFIVGEMSLPKLLDAIDDRLNLSSRYEFTARFINTHAVDPQARDVVVFHSANDEPQPNERLRQSATFNLLGQRVVLELMPRPEFIAPNRQFLPEVALLSGLGVSVLLGLVVNLAQSARNRQRAAETTSEQLRSENEERRRIEARLKVTDERLNLALEATHIGVIEWNLNDGRAIYSAGFWTSLGYDAAFMPAMQETLLKLIHPDDLKAYHTALDAHLAGKADLFECEFRIKRQSAEWEWLSLRAKCVGTDRIGRPLRMAGTCQNVTSRKHQQEALRASQAATRKLSLVASRTDNAVVITRPDGRVEWVNESFSRLAEHTLEDIGGRPFVELLSSPEHDLAAVERITRAFARREAITTDVIHHSRSGRRYHVHLELQPVLNDEGAVENFIVIETDITSRVEVEQQLRRAKAEADSASRAKSEFLASMSHEIRTPMNGVIGMTSLLMETPLTPEQRDYVQTIRTSGDALLSIINEILDFSKIESGRMELERHPFELAQCVEETIDIFALQAAAKGIELAYAIDGAVPAWIVGDITRLRQVLVNLVNNAVKFTPSGFITIEVTLGTAPDATGACLVDFVVADTGIGIPTDRQSALFKPFSQVDSSTTRKYGGTGLGLAICDRLVQLMGGTIDVASQLGHGSRFRFTIQTAAAEIPSGGRVLNFGGVPVLAVDDHAVNRRALEACLTLWGCTPFLAENGTRALQIAAAKPPAIAIVDHDLNGETGEALIAQLHTAYPHLPVVLLTAASDGVRHGQSHAPFVTRLPKPIKPVFLGEAVARLMKGGALPPPPAPAPVRPHAELAREIPLDILLVEDNPVNQKVALHLLTRLGYRADAVSNGLEAVRAAEQRDYDLVFMDVQMPEMDGLAATHEIRTRLPRERQPRIVALTANAVQGDRERCLAAGMDDYLPKPVKLDELHGMVRKYFGAPHASS
jgi:PAS domain S-box-containing protein